MTSKVINRTFATQLLNFVPKHAPVAPSDVESLRNFIDKSQRILVLTGAGISTESGIPDYRSEEVGLYARTNHKPIQYQEFVKSASVRQRYWARNYVGWDTFSSRSPNNTHLCVRKLETLSKVSAVVTQNVDGLHFKAGSENVIELHGTAFKVVCMQCGNVYDRHEIQRQINNLNPDLNETSTMIRPDGDVELPQEYVVNFRPPFCKDCGGFLKPDIVFFGDNVPKTRVKVVNRAVSDSDALLVLGSSLTVFSSFRIVLQAADENKDVAIVNIGPTRADKYARLRISAKCGDILPRIC